MTRLALLVFGALAVAACGSSPRSPVSTPSPHAAGGDPTCPMEIPGTTADSETTTGDSAAFVFTTTGDVAAVRERARALAAMALSHQGAPGSMGLMVTDPVSNVVAVEVPGGAKVVFTAGSAEAAAELQRDVPMHASHLVAGSCKMKM